MKDRIPTPRWKQIIEFDNFRFPPYPQGVQVTKKLADDGPFGKDRNSRTRKKEKSFRAWNSRASYHEHPYWTTNLKYVY
jgi:hypothetical protein